jgi:hypothetical protein
MEYIICSAIHYENGKEYLHQPKNIKTGFVVCGRRHYNIISLMVNFDVITIGRNHIQGFLTSKDEFVDRTKAYYIAKNAKQLIKEPLNDEIYELTSEDLY